MDSSPVQQSLTELLRRTEITCKARYHASRRMTAHGWCSQWTLALLAVGQIVVAVAVAMKLRTNLPSELVEFGAVFFAVLVLAYSLLLGMGNYGSRSVKFHQCGLELGRLARRLFLLSRSVGSTDKDYETASKDYYDILAKYENHTRTNYLVASHEYESRGLAALPSFGKAWWLKRQSLLLLRVERSIRDALQFSHYTLSVALAAVCIGLLLYPPHT